MNTSIHANVEYTLTEGNAFTVLADFRRAARLAGWTTQQLEHVTTKCLAGDNNHLVRTIAGYCVTQTSSAS